MDIEARIRRRRRRNGGGSFVRDYDALNPAAHVTEPVAHSPLIEQLLDHLDPVFDGRLPPNLVLSGPMGSGKSAVVTALFDQLAELSLPSGGVIHTNTRVERVGSPVFLYLDHRTVASEFNLYHALLDDLVEESVPEHGVGTAALRGRLVDRLEAMDVGAVVALDHADEGEDFAGERSVSLLEDLETPVAWLAIGRGNVVEPEMSSGEVATIEVDPYQEQVLVDVLMERATDALSQRALDHTQARTIATWADSNAHHALAALFGAAEHASTTGRTRLADEDVEAGIRSIPTPCVATGRVLALTPNRQAVLRELVDLSDDERVPVSAAAETIAGRGRVDLSPGTVKRFLYELAERGIVERVKDERPANQGRPPSRIEPRFPTPVFRRLYDIGL